jgi:hypothetical protein
VAGLLLPGIVRLRGQADRKMCLSRFQALGQFAALSQHPPKGMTRADVPQAVPPGTIFNPALAPDARLSWIADVLPLLDQRLQPLDPIAAKIDKAAAWDAPANREAGRTRLVLFTCPGAVPEVADGTDMPTQFVGLSGDGTASATLGLGPPVPPRAGCFRYDAPTPLALISAHDGLSHTVLFAETANDLGPWARGGPSTVRGLDVGDGAKPPLGRGGQFGGNYDGVTGFGFADGSAQFLRDSTSLDILRALLTIAGGGEDPIPGE